MIRRRKRSRQVKRRRKRCLKRRRIGKKKQ